MSRAQVTLLEKLEEQLRELQCSKLYLNDSDSGVITLCSLLEQVLRKGMREGVFAPRDYWDWIDSLLDYAGSKSLRINPPLAMAICTVRGQANLLTSQGKGRFFVRLALNNKLMSAPMEHLLKNSRLLKHWYETQSTEFAKTEQDSFRFMAILFNLTELNFCLNIQNSSFLDDTWLLPETLHVDLPSPQCREFCSLTLVCSRGRVVIRSVDHNDYLEEQNHILVGDIIDSINGVSLKSVTKDKVIEVLENVVDGPLWLTIIKSSSRMGGVYAPASEAVSKALITGSLRLQEEIQVATVLELSQHSSADFFDTSDKPEHVHTFLVRYVGRLLLEEGFATASLEGCVNELVSRHKEVCGTGYSYRKPGEAWSITLAPSQGSISLYCRPEKEAHWSLVVRYLGAQVSACQAGLQSPCCISFMIRTESDVTEQVCYVFDANSKEEAASIQSLMETISSRTTWFVRL